MFAHFGSKEELQVAAVEAAGNRYMEEAFLPALQAERGYPRLLAICRSWIDYLERGVFPGGCFFAAASFEFDGRPGPVRNAIVKRMDEWLEAIRKAIRIAQDEGHLMRSVDAAQIAFEMNALFFGANFSYQMLNEKDAPERAWTAIEARLSALRTMPAKARMPRRAARSSRPRQRVRR